MSVVSGGRQLGRLVFLELLELLDTRDCLT